MCGISGIFHFSAARPVDTAALAAMDAVQRHRGPDGSGVFLGERCGLANSRLAIVDRAGGAQPMSNEAGTVWITYNGEVFEHAALRAELEARGYRFRTRSDTEVVLRAYEAFGEGCVERLDGQFAFAVWDATRARLLLARDRLGIAPLHYAAGVERLLFASEIKALLAHPGMTARADTVAVAETLLCGTLFDGRTMFEGVRALEPGCTLSVTPSGLRGRRYWEVPLTPERPAPREEEYAERLLPLLEHAVALRVPSEVPWGVLLSGGTDSSAVGTLAARTSRQPLRTFTLDFPDPWKGTETDARYARDVAARLGARHHAFIVEPQRYFEVLEHLVWHVERPFNKGAASLYLLYERVREHATVVLCGEGADELFGGYVGSRGLGLDGDPAAPPDALPWAPHWRLASRLLAPELRAALEPEALLAERLRGALAATGAAEPLNRALHLYCKHFLAELLEIHDRTALAFGVEGRMPFLDHRFVELFAPMPAHLKHADGESKRLLKRAIAALVPPEVIARRKTHMPIPRDPRSVLGQIERTRELLLAPEARAVRYFDRARVRDLLERRGEFAEADLVGVWQLTHQLITLELHHRVFRL